MGTELQARLTRRARVRLIHVFFYWNL
jgi:hypothetical protein